MTWMKIQKLYVECGPNIRRIPWCLVSLFFFLLFLSVLQHNQTLSSSTTPSPTLSLSLFFNAGSVQLSIFLHFFAVKNKPSWKNPSFLLSMVSAKVVAKFHHKVILFFIAFAFINSVMQKSLSFILVGANLLCVFEAFFYFVIIKLFH